MSCYEAQDGFKLKIYAWLLSFLFLTFLFDFLVSLLSAVLLTSYTSRIEPVFMTKCFEGSKISTSGSSPSGQGCCLDKGVSICLRPTCK
jgi:hypothetical protein